MALYSAVQCVKSFIPGCACYDWCYMGTPQHLKKYQSREESESSKEVKDIIRRVLKQEASSPMVPPRALEHPYAELRPYIYRMLARLMNAQSVQDVSQLAMDSSLLAQKIDELVSEKFKIVKASWGEREVFSVAIGSSQKNTKETDADYIIGVSSGAIKEKSILRELYYILVEKESTTALEKGVCSILASGVTAYIFPPSIPPSVLGVMSILGASAGASCCVDQIENRDPHEENFIKKYSSKQD